MTELAVLLNGIVVARAYEEGNQKVLAYDPAVASSTQEYLSMSMPPRLDKYSGKMVENWLFNLLPDNDSTLNWIANNTELGPICSPKNPIRLLEKVGEDCSGAVQLVPFSRIATLDPGSLEFLSDEEIECKLKDIRMGGGHFGQNHGYFSLAGAQPKLALRKSSDGRWASTRGNEATSHILKPPMERFEGQIQGEHLCLELARKCGLPAASSEIVSFGNETAIAVERFDREYDENGKSIRLHTEDMCQALGYSSEKKYQNYGGPGIEEIIIFLRQHASEDEAILFFRACIFNWIIGGTDAHAKNYSIFLGSGKVILTPLYDLNTLLPYTDNIDREKMSMSINKKYQFGQVQIRDWVKMAEKCGLPLENLPKDIMVMSLNIMSILLDLGYDLYKKYNDPAYTDIAEKIYKRAQFIISELV